jgi:hypothetical protein
MDEIPAIVAKFAASQAMPPMKWRMTDTQVVIIFENGQKMTFDRLEPFKAGPTDQTKAEPDEDPDAEIFKELDAANPPKPTRRGQAATRKAR